MNQSLARGKCFVTMSCYYCYDLSSLTAGLQLPGQAGLDDGRDLELRAGAQTGGAGHSRLRVARRRSR